MALFDTAWATALFVVALVVVFILLFVLAIKIWARRTYWRLLKHPETPLDINAFVNVDKNPIGFVYCVMVHRLSVGYRQVNSDPIPLSSDESPHVAGLQIVSKQNTDNAREQETMTNADAATLFPSNHRNNNTPYIVIGTIRMGFGHHRIAYAATSWALEQFGASNVYFHDFLNIDSPEADLVKGTDDLYSKGSRLASEMGGPIEKIWGNLMLSGNANALRVAGLLAVHLRPLLSNYPKDTPFIATHQLVALTAVAAGFTNVINLVIDNHPQWFLTVPQCLNLVQGPVNYQCFLKMGIPRESLALAGHWCPRQLVDNIAQDCSRRISRVQTQVAFGNENGNDDETKKTKLPCRLLIPVGGAGAQRKFILQFVKALAPYVKKGDVQLILNAGDHQHMRMAFTELLTDKLGLDFDVVDSIEGVRALQEKLLVEHNEPCNNADITLLSFPDYFPAVASTDILCRVADVLACKPSEMAFYPIPKLMIRRVGDHEADSAKRASELGGGTCEAREITDCLEYIDLFVQSPDLLVQMNKSIMKNAEQGIYDGCKNAIKRIMEMRKRNDVVRLGPDL